MKQQIYSVTNIVHYMKQTLDQDLRLQSILIKGEVSNFTNHRSGHWYFTLKDNKSKISCVMFASYACKCKFLLKEGMKIIVKASVSMYEATGSVQLYVTAVQNDGLGDLYLQLEEVKERLRCEGMFDPAHKKQLPLYPMRIGIVTAKTGAAIQDMLKTLAVRWPFVEVTLYPSLVQGAYAAQNLIENLKKADEEEQDVILLARGGGAIEDLWCFNDEQLARCVFSLRTPIITGVGHESDTTLVDYVSDVRASTPTQAAQIATPMWEEVKEQIVRYQKDLHLHVTQKIKQEQERLQRIKQNRYIENPLTYIQEEQFRMAMLTRRLSIVEYFEQKQRSLLLRMSAQLGQLATTVLHEEETRVQKRKQIMLQRMELLKQKYRHQMQHSISLLDAYSPLKVLHRGYAMVKKEDRLVRQVNDVANQDQITVYVQDGTFSAVVVKEEEK